MANFSISCTATSVTFRVTGLHAGESVWLYARYEPHTGSPVVDSTYTATGTSMTKTFSINDGCNYAANVRVGTTWLGTKYFSTPVSPPPFTSFSWTYAGLDANGARVSGSQKKSGLGVCVTASEWNTLAGLVASETGRSVTTVSSGTTISAAIVNTMANALGVATVSAGDAISADFFNSLSSAYNALG